MLNRRFQWALCNFSDVADSGPEVHLACLSMVLAGTVAWPPAGRTLLLPSSALQ